MWTCKQCGTDVEFALAMPHIDSEGCCFACPSCGKRNVLVNVGGKGDDDPIELAQLDS